MSTILLWIHVAFIYTGYVLSDDIPCQEGSAQHTNIYFANVTSNFNFEIWNKSNPYNYSLTVTYKWDLGIPRDFVFDGFLYKHVDREKEEKKLSSQNIGFGSLFGISSFGIQGLASLPEDKKCDNSSDKSLWAVNNNGSSVECKIPCSEYLPPPCQSNEVCSRIIEDGFSTLPREANQLEVALEFGRSYDMKILIYRHWKVLKTYEFPHNKIIRFCRDELIDKQKYEPGFADAFCEREQDMQESTLSAGPPSYFEMYSVNRDLRTNRGNVGFRWKAPMDISKRVNLTGFLINTHSGLGQDIMIKVDQHDVDFFYKTSVKNIVFEKPHLISITPILTFDINICYKKCSKHGYILSKEYTIPDIDACDEPTRYCDIIANCTDLPSQNTTSAICSCPIGFSGNGINDSRSEGTGCQKINRCNFSIESYPCHSNAICEDFDSTSESVICSCPKYYVGNGYKEGYGCMKLSIVVFLSIGIPCIFIFLIILMMLMRRIKITRKRTIRRKFSKFVMTSDAKYTSPDWSIKFNNNTKQCGLFGEKYEIDRNDIQFTEIIGRGNFGVVHKAILKTKENESKEVAVKTTAEPHTIEMEMEFQAEIYLITSLNKHANIMGMIGCCTMGKSPIYLVTQFMKYGDLKHFLWDAREEKNRARDLIYNITERDIYRIGEQVASGMEYLTGLRFIHGDLAARNVLVDEGLQCKISDFGLTNDVYRYGVIKGAREKKVPLRWISPERMLNGTVPITWRSDVWSFGILLYEAITLGSTPYPGIESEDLLKKVQSGYRMSCPSTCSQHLYNVMLNCWEWIPSNRPSFKQLRETLKMPVTKLRQHYVNISAVEYNS
ncbi:uncharacterized protein LOC120343076 [Styela clava]